MNKNLTMLMILDGFGKNPNKEGNAVEIANTPNIDKLMKENPTTTIYTSGLHVGLPEGQMGNSEVGHTNIGAGRIVYQDLAKITKSIEEGNFFSIRRINLLAFCSAFWVTVQVLIIPIKVVLSVSEDEERPSIETENL